MAQKKKSTKRKNSTTKNVNNNVKAAERPPRRREAGALICLFLGLFALLGCFNTNAIFIDFFCGLVKGLIGWGFYFMPVALFCCAAILGFHRGRPVQYRVICALLITVVVGALSHLIFCRIEYKFAGEMFGLLWKDGAAVKSGGIISGMLAVLFKYLFSGIGAGIVFFFGLAFLLLGTFKLTLSGIFDRWKSREHKEYEPEPEPSKPMPVMKEPKRELGRKKPVIDIALDEPVEAENILEVEKKPSFFNRKPRAVPPDQVIAETTDAPDAAEEDAPKMIDVPLDIPFMESGFGSAQKSAAAKPAPEETKPEIVGIEPAESSAQDDELKIEIPAPPKDSEAEKYIFPPIDLLNEARPGGRVDGTEEAHINSERLETAFRSFGINVKISNFTRGPTVTCYEAELEAGVKLNKLTNLADDIALSLGSSGVRIAAMPNKISTVGIEVPNKLVSTVFLRDIIDSAEFKNAQSKITFAIGKNIGGESIVGNIAKLPHLLVAGTTGSGKSVCLNSLILSILYKARPEEVKLIMIDPKMVEFRVYNGIPHLLVPVVTEVKKAAGALQWAVVEMMKRYRLFSETGARDLEGYNNIMQETEDGQPIPQIVIVIDELADLMLTAAKEVEESVCRVAQMGRAAGVHLVIATQSPRADVITGLMKANIPSRIALKVSSALESRIILDAGGNADKLVGTGDMLYAPIGTTKPVRIQGTWVSDGEREKVVEFIKARGETQYSDEVISEIDKASEDKKNGNGQEPSEDRVSDYDDLLPQAVDVILESGQASVSMLQRRLKLGYSRAARIVDQMEEMGVVGPFEGSKPRQLLITREQWQEMQFVNNTAPVETVPSEEAFEPDEE